MRSPLPVLVDFWAPWCRPCRIVASSLDWIASSFAERAKVVRVNTDLNRRLAERFKIRGLPTVKVFSDGKVHSSAMGVRPPEEYARYPRAGPRRACQRGATLSAPPQTSQAADRLGLARPSEAGSGSRESS